MHVRVVVGLVLHDMRGSAMHSERDGFAFAPAWSLDQSKESSEQWKMQDLV